jgi:hypothetical protein
MPSLAGVGWLDVAGAEILPRGVSDGENLDAVLVDAEQDPVRLAASDPVKKFPQLE